MRRFLQWLGLIILVWTEDFDGELRLRMVWSDGNRPFVFCIVSPPFSFAERHRAYLNEDGTISHTYMKRWHFYEDKPNRTNMKIRPARSLKI
jgi:hypothetical protein